MSKSLFDDVPEPLFDSEDAEEQTPDVPSPVATEEETADEQPPVDPVDDADLEDIGQNTPFTATWSTPVFNFQAGDNYGQVTTTVTFSLPVVKTTFTGADLILGSFAAYDDFTIVGRGTETTATIFDITVDIDREGLNGPAAFRWRDTGGVGNRDTLTYIREDGTRISQRLSRITSTLPSVTIDTRMTATWSTPTFNSALGVGGQITVTLTLNRPRPLRRGSSIGIFADDVWLRQSTNLFNRFSGWNLSISANGRVYTITATPAVNINLSNIYFYVAFGHNVESSRSPTFSVDNRRNASWGTPVFCNTSGAHGRVTAVITFSLSVTNVEAADFEVRNQANTAEVTGWTIAVSGTGTTRTVTADAPEGTNAFFRLRLKQNSVVYTGQGAGPHANIDSGTVLVDNTVGATWGTPAFCGGSNRLTTTLTFTETVTGFTDSDIVIRDNGNANQNGWTHEITGSGINYTVTTTPPSNTNGIFYLVLPATSVVHGNVTGPDEEVRSAIFNVDNRITGEGDVAAITFGDSYFDATARRVNWSAFVTGTDDENEISAFTAADITVNNVVSDGTAFTPTVTVTRTPATGTSFNIQTTQFPAGRVGDISISIREDALGDDTNKPITSGCVNYDTRAAATPTVATATWGTPAAHTGVNAVLQGRITFGGTTIPVTNIEPGDFDVIVNTPLGNVVHPEASWTIQVSHSNVTTGRRYVDVTAIPNGTFVASFGLRLREDSVRSDGATMDNAPENNVDSTTVAFNNRDTREDIVPQVIIGTGAFCPTSRKITWPISVVNADATEFAALTEDDITITDTSTVMPALTETIVSRGTNSLIVEILVPTERNGTASITVAANALGTNTNTAATSNDVAYDTRTTVTATTITYGTPVPDNAGRDIEFPVTFSDIGEGLTGDDFTVTADNGVWGVTIRDGTGGPNTRVIVVTNTEPYARMGNLTITIAADAFTNRTVSDPRTSPSAAYNLASTITETTVTYINLPGYAGQNFVVTNNNRTIEFRLEFSDIGAGLAPDDFTVDATNGNWVVSLEHEGSNTVRVTVTETGSSSLSGSLTITVAEDAFFNRTITGNRVSPSATYALTTSTTLPSVDITLDRTGPIRFGEEFSIFFTWDRDVTTFTQYGIQLNPGIGGLFSTVRTENQQFFGSGRSYRLTLSTISFDPTRDSYLDVYVHANALSGGNVPAFLRIPIGTGEITPTLLTANQVAGDGLAYTKDAIYTIGQDEADTTARLRSYNESGVLQTNNLVSVGSQIDLGQERHARSIDILDNRFLISARYFGTFGITRATGYVEDSRTFNKLFINSGDYVNSFEVIHSVEDPIEDARLRNHPDPEARVGNERVLARVPARAIQRRNEFVTRTFTSRRVATDTAVEAIAVGSNRIYLLVSGGSAAEPQYDIQIYDLFGSLITSISVDTNTENTKQFRSVPASLVATSRFLYLGFASFEDPLTGTTVTAQDLFAYTLDGERIPNEDLKLNIGQGAGEQDWYYGVISMDWNETDERMWMIIRRVRKLDAVTEQWFGYFSLNYPVDPKWSAIKPQILEAGNIFDLKPFAGNIDTIRFAAGVAVPSWLSLSNGVLTVASSGLPTTNVTSRVSFIGIGTGRPAYVSFDLTLLREAPTWRTI